MQIGLYVCHRESNNSNNKDRERIGLDNTDDDNDAAGTGPVESLVRSTRETSTAKVAIPLVVNIITLAIMQQQLRRQRTCYTTCFILKTQIKKRLLGWALRETRCNVRALSILGPFHLSLRFSNQHTLRFASYRKGNSMGQRLQVASRHRCCRDMYENAFAWRPTPKQVFFSFANSLASRWDSTHVYITPCCIRLLRSRSSFHCHPTFANQDTKSPRRFA